MGIFSQYTRTATALQDNLLLMDDIHDTTMAPTGTTKSLTINNAVAAAVPVQLAQRILAV